MTNKFKIITFGCRVNQAESRQIGQDLAKLNLRYENNLNLADLIIINTCCVTNKAEKEVRKQIRRVKRENKNCFLIVTGCWINNQKNQSQDIKLLNLIDLKVLNKNKKNLAALIKKSRIKNSESLKKQSKQAAYQDKYARHQKAMVKIQEGCNNFCTYCIVPFVRGRSRSKAAEEILADINKLQDNNIKEVVLTGVDIADYKFKICDKSLKKIADGVNLIQYKNNLVKLILLILLKTDIKKISFGSLGLNIIDNEFIDLYKRQRKSAKINNFNQRLTTHFHIPLQSGCKQTLDRMKRGYTTEEFFKTVKNLYDKIPNFSFSTDIIVGFPGETKQEFTKTINFIKKLKSLLGNTFVKAHIFRYSPKKGTTAFKLADQWKRVRAEDKKKRAKYIKNLIS